MPTHSTLTPIDATVKALDAQLDAIDAAPSIGAVTAYKAAIARHGHQLAEAEGIEALTVVLAQVRADAPDKAASVERERIVLLAWAPLMQDAA